MGPWKDLRVVCRVGPEIGKTTVVLLANANDGMTEFMAVWLIAQRWDNSTEIWMYLPEDQSAIDYRRRHGAGVGHKSPVTVWNNTDIHKFAADS